MSDSRRLLHSLVRPLEAEENDCAARLRLALELMGAGLEMKRLNLRRAYPQEGPEEIAARLSQWVQDQPIPPGLRLRELP